MVRAGPWSPVAAKLSLATSGLYEASGGVPVASRWLPSGFPAQTIVYRRVAMATYRGPRRVSDAELELILAIVVASFDSEHEFSFDQVRATYRVYLDTYFPLPEDEAGDAGDVDDGDETDPDMPALVDSTPRDEELGDIVRDIVTMSWGDDSEMPRLLP